MKKFLYNLPECLLAIVVIAITAVVVYEFFVREVFGTSIFGITSDLTHLFMVWLSLLGAAVAVKRGSHFVFPIVAQRLGPGIGPYLASFSCASIIVFSAVMVWIGIRVAYLARNETFIAIPVSLFWEILALPTSAALTLIYCIPLMRNQIRDLKKKRASDQGQP